MITKKTIPIIIVVLAIITSSACQGSPKSEDGDQALQRQLTPTITPTVLAMQADVVTETPEKPLPSGYFEVHVRTVVQEEQECIVKYPFIAHVEDGRLLLVGEDNVDIDCAFAGEFCGRDGCIDIHLKYLLETWIEAEVLGYSSEPQPVLHAFFRYDGEMQVFYSGFPPEAFNPWPEDDPLVLPLTDIATLVLPFENDAKDAIPIGIGIDQQMEIPQPEWEFVLKLDQ